MDFSSVAGKVVIVTGASRGIGEAIARVYGEHGMKVVCAARSTEQGQAVADSIVSAGGDAIFVQTDCSDAGQIKRLVQKAVEHYGRLDGMVSNAGIGLGGTPLHEYTDEDYDHIFALNSKGVFAGMKYAAEAILRSGSEGGFLNAICPGYTKTSIFGDAPDAALTFFAKDCPAGRMGDPRECAYLALFLASDMARYITGAAIPVDGALSAGHQNITSWKHPEILSEGKLS